MITYKQALSIVKKTKSQFDTCRETTHAYIFFVGDDGESDDEYTIGGDEPAVVLKSTGECINFVSYINECPGDKDIKTYEI
ncbi:MAG: hypothetical protein LKF61_01225 [Eggerthellaceae bacterium]|jgi:hypothetical protein|nr:hypothetical protein [Eggerthellaceae bacterium]MCH4221649.1 hypothetical protein [Eggerthellaceae bacterium]